MTNINPDMHKQIQEDPIIHIKTRFWQKPYFKICLSFSGGFLIGALLVVFFEIGHSKSLFDKEDLKGTIYESRGSGPLKVAGEFSYDQDDIKAIWLVKNSPEVVEIQLDLASEGPIVSSIEFDMLYFRVLSVRCVNSNELTNVRSSSNSVRIDSWGTNKYIILLYSQDNAPHDINCKVTQNDMPLYHNVVTINKPG